MKAARHSRPVLLAFVLVFLALAHAQDHSQDRDDEHHSFKGHPNILFIIMDDVGIDQLKAFGYGGLTPPQTPNINAIAKAGVRFRNTWAMPECCIRSLRGS